MTKQTTQHKEEITAEDEYPCTKEDLSMQPAIEAQEHINAASQALKNGNNSEVSLQLQLANQMLSQFIGGGGVGNATAENTTAPPTGYTGTKLPASQTESINNSSDEVLLQMSKKQERSGTR